MVVETSPLAYYHLMMVLGSVSPPCFRSMIPAIAGVLPYPVRALLLQGVDAAPVVHLGTTTRNVTVSVPPVATLSLVRSMMRMSTSKGSVVLVGSSLLL